MSSGLSHPQTDPHPEGPPDLPQDSLAELSAEFLEHLPGAPPPNGRSTPSTGNSPENGGPRPKKALTLLFGIGLAILLAARAGASHLALGTAWSKTYTGTQNQIDVVADTAVDGAGNVYVTGTSTVGSKKMIVTVKYDSLGGLIWEDRYYTASNIEARKLVLDDSGNPYVGGFRNTPGQGDDMLVIRYHPAGFRNWERTYNGTGNGHDQVFDLAVAGSSVVATGFSWGTGTDYDIATVSFPMSGNTPSAVRFDTGNAYDQGNSILVDGSDVYVGGVSAGNTTLIKYTSFNNQAWVRHFDGAAGGYDEIWDLAKTSSGVVAVGTTTGVGTGRNYLALLYSAAGTHENTLSYAGFGAGADEARSVVSDGGDTFYMTGFSEGGTSGKDALTLKYVANTLVWDNRYDSGSNLEDAGAEIARDAAGNVYVVGHADNPTTARDILLLKYSAPGGLLWSVHSEGATAVDNTADDLALDSSGYPVVAGTSDGGATFSDFHLLKVSGSGSILVNSKYNGVRHTTEHFNDVKVDASGNVVATGVTADTFGGGYDFITVKYSPSGARLWEARYDGTGGGHDIARALVVDSVGNTYVTGSSDGGSSSHDYVTIKYDPEGNEVWVQRFDGRSNGYAEANAMAISAEGNLFITGWGQSVDAGNGDDIFTVSYSPSGSLRYATRFFSPGSAADIGRDIAVDSDGNAYVAGSASGFGTSNDFIILKYGTGGNQVWARRYNAENGSDQARKIAVDASGVYVTGEIFQPTGGFNFATLKLRTSDGGDIWGAIYDGPDSSDDYPVDLVIGPTGNACVTGRSASFGAGFDIATVQYSATGSELWTARQGGPGTSNDYPVGLVVDAELNVYVSGNFALPDPRWVTLKYASDGNLASSPKIHGSEYQSDEAMAIALGPADEVAVAGYVYSPYPTWNNAAVVKYVSVPPAADITSQVTVQRSGFRRQLATGRYVQTVTIRNPGTTPLFGPFAIAVSGLPTNASLHNFDGVTEHYTPFGSRYRNVAVPNPDSSLAPGATVSVTLEFTNPNNLNLNYSARILAGNGPR